MTEGDAIRRRRMVQDLAARGLKDERVLDAMGAVPERRAGNPTYRLSQELWPT